MSEQTKVRDNVLFVLLGAGILASGLVSSALFNFGFRDASLWALWFTITLVIAEAALLTGYVRPGVAVSIVTFGVFACGQILLGHQDDHAPAITGLLRPGDAPTPEIKAPELWKDKLKIPDSALFLFFGNSVAWTSKYPHMDVLCQQDEPMITIDKEPSGIAISAKLFDKDGKIICDIEKNEFHINANNYHRMKRTAHTLTVIDQEARPALEVEFINPHAVRFLGDFYLRRGTHIVIKETLQNLGGSPMSGNILGDNGGCAFRVE